MTDRHDPTDPHADHADRASRRAADRGPIGSGAYAIPGEIAAILSRAELRRATVIAWALRLRANPNRLASWHDFVAGVLADAGSFDGHLVGLPDGRYPADDPVAAQTVDANQSTRPSLFKPFALPTILVDGFTSTGAIRALMLSWTACAVHSAAIRERADGKDIARAAATFATFVETGSVVDMVSRY